MIVVGGGPAGLMAAEVLAEGGLRVDLYDAMPSVGRKFLLAGIGGLNLTHSEPLPRFVARYGAAAPTVGTWLGAFGPDAVRSWAAGLGVETFVGSSGRVFPRDMKAAPLLRAWLHRLRQQGVRFHMRHRWDGSLVATPDAGGGWELGFQTQDGHASVQAEAVVLALGGGSWRKLGSDGAWMPWLASRGVATSALRPANCGFDAAGWSEHFAERQAGAPLKSVAAAVVPHGEDPIDTAALAWQPGECVVTRSGLEGSLVYALSATLRDRIAECGSVRLAIDLLPARSAAWVAAELAHPRGPRSWSTHLKSRLGLHGVKAALLREVLGAEQWSEPASAAAAIKALPVTLVAPRPIDEAISTAGGVCLDALDDLLMASALPGVFCAGEMLDWEAPTGGYLLSACLASGRLAALGARRRLDRP